MIKLEIVFYLQYKFKLIMNKPFSFTWFNQDGKRGGTAPQGDGRTKGDKKHFVFNGKGKKYRYFKKNLILRLVSQRISI